MKKTFIDYYYDLFDNRIADSSIVVGLIGLVIFFVGFFAPIKNHTNFYMKSNILEINNYKLNNNYILIDGKKYILKEYK